MIDRRAVLGLLLGGLSAWCVVAGGGERPTVAPGGVVRWHGAGTTECRAEGRTWQPQVDVCWFPVDLLHGEGEMVVTRERRGRPEETTFRVGPYPYPVQHLTLPESMVELSEEDLARVDKEQRRVAGLWRRGGLPQFTLPLAPPLRVLPEGGRFGSRRFFNGEPRSPHSGADYRAPRGTAVHAVATGVVALAEEHFFAGNGVFIDHGDSMVSMYFHLAELKVVEGQSVERGQVVGTVGATGRATGPHLHFGIRWRGARIDPQLLFGPVDRVPEL